VGLIAPLLARIHLPLDLLQQFKHQLHVKTLASTATSKVKQLAYSDDARSADLKFVADLGRSLLFTVHPRKVALKVAEALLSGVDAEVCAFVFEADNIGLISCAFDAGGEVKRVEFLSRPRFEEWAQLLPPQIGYAEEKRDRFMLSLDSHAVEYVSPLHLGGVIKGAIVTGFANKQSVTEQKTRLIDAVTQMAAMSVNLSAHYESAINDSVLRAKEEHRRFTEAVLDALPVSLYVVDRDYRIVTWNRNREDGAQGVPRDAVIGRDVFQVLARYPEGRMRREFERAFETGKIERIEQQTVGEDGEAPRPAKSRT